MMTRLIALLIILTVATPAFAVCEDPFTSNAAIQALATEDTTNLNNYITQEKNFVTEDLTHTATFEVMARLDEFDVNLRGWLTAWWEQGFYPVLKAMTKQMSASQIQQIRHLGSLMDAMKEVETLRKKEKKKKKSVQKYAPNELLAQIDSNGPGQNKSLHMAKAITRGFVVDDSSRRSNAKGSISATGKGAEIKALWSEYKNKFCDPAKGDPGCDQAGVLAGKNRDIPWLLWSDTQTIDLSVPDNRLLVRAALRTLLYPQSNDPIPAGALNSAAGREAMLARRAEEARINTIYHAMAAMVGERVGGGSGVSTQPFMTATGAPPQTGSPDASYADLRRSMAKERYLDPAYVAKMIGSPQQVVKEMGTVNAVRLQTLHDIFRRQEEMLAMEAAVYARNLDKRAPGAAVSASPLR